jgi:serine/threonine protein phosphatase PrpC
MTQRSLALLGRDYPELGPLALASLPDGGALGLGRGAHPKAYRHTDPNEDATLLVRTNEGALLAVADGYNGVAASELAVESVRLCAAELICAQGERFEARTQALIDDLVRGMADLGRSRTCLVLATIRGRDCHFALFGDCSVWRANEAEAQSAPNDLILGPRFSLVGIPEIVWSGYFTRDPDERIALVSDGITNFVPDPNKIPLLLQQAKDDPAAARIVAETAMTGGAGDNVAVATIAALDTGD